MISIQSHHHRPEYQLTNGDHVHDDDPQVKRDEGKVDQLYSRPKVPVRLESWPPSAVQLFLDVGGVSTLEDGHSRKECSYTDRREEELVGGDTSEGLRPHTLLDHHELLEDLEPHSGSGAENDFTITCQLG
jgi:hypothetical protein